MKNKKYTLPDEDDYLPLLNEAAVAYEAATKNIYNPLALMGVENKDLIYSIENTVDFIAYIKEGIPKKSLDHLAETIGLSGAEVAGIVHTSERTLRRYTASQKLNTEQSERTIELACLYARGAEVFDNLEQFKTWMELPVGALGDVKPKTFLDTSMGIQFLTEELGRIEHGIFA